MPTQELQQRQILSQQQLQALNILSLDGAALDEMLKKEEIDLTIAGRHDPALVRRVCPVIDSVTALVLCDLLAERYGTDIFLKSREAF